ncbi:MAG: hypothetical protein ACO1TE_07850 [Prosthecobacter sp.]
MEFEVRDSSCEAVLERLKEELSHHPDDKTALALVSEWHAYWIGMPPGCKDMALKVTTAEVGESIKRALGSVILALPAEGEAARVAGRMQALLC